MDRCKCTTVAEQDQHYTQAVSPSCNQPNGWPALFTGQRDAERAWPKAALARIFYAYSCKTNALSGLLKKAVYPISYYFIITLPIKCVRRGPGELYNISHSRVALQQNHKLMHVQLV